MAQVVVVGGGYAGTMAAIRLARRTRGHDVTVTLINPYDRFVERLRLHQRAAGQDIREHRLSELLKGSGVRLVVGWASAIDTRRRTVRVGVELIPYDRLIVALGSHANLDAVPGAAEHAMAVDDYDSATRLRAHLAALPDGAHIAVIGGGLTAIETASEFAESYPRLRVRLVSDGEPGAMMGPRARAYMCRALARLGVEVRAGVGVEKVLPDAVRLADGEHLPADLCVWTAGVTVSRLAADAGIACDRNGRIETDRELRSVSHPDVYAIGDAAAIHQRYGVMHGTCQGGTPSGIHAADQVARDLGGKPLRPFRFGYIHQPVSLGRHDAVIQFVKRNDSPRRAVLTGKLAVRYKETVSSSPIPAYRLSRRWTVPARMVWRGDGS